VRDEVWFVRLRATIALNEIRHPRTIPLPLEAVRDSNRLVRRRAASTLARSNGIDWKFSKTSSIHGTAMRCTHDFRARPWRGLRANFERTFPMLHNEAAERLLATLRESAAGLWTTRPADPVVESVFP